MRKLYAKIPSDRPPRGTKGMRAFVEANKSALEDYANANRDALRDGNTVVVSGQDLYEGKVME